MSLIVAAIAAAGAAGVTATALALRRWSKRRQQAKRATAAQADSARSSEPGQASQRQKPTALVVNLGDVVQLYDTTRWLRAAVHVWENGQLRCSLLFAEEKGHQVPVVAFAPPDDHIYWLTPTQAVLPPQPPSRIELADCLFDRRASFPAALQPVGPAPERLCGNGVLSLYEAAVGDVAVVLHCSAGHLAYVGHRLEPGDYDRLGPVDPASDELGSA